MEIEDAFVCSNRCQPQRPRILRKTAAIVCIARYKIRLPDASTKCLSRDRLMVFAIHAPGAQDLSQLEPWHCNQSGQFPSRSNNFVSRKCQAVFFPGFNKLASRRGGDMLLLLKYPKSGLWYFCLSPRRSRYLGHCTTTSPFLALVENKCHLSFDFLHRAPHQHLPFVEDMLMPCHDKGAQHDHPIRRITIYSCTYAWPCNETIIITYVEISTYASMWFGSTVSLEYLNENRGGQQGSSKSVEE